MNEPKGTMHAMEEQLDKTGKGNGLVGEERHATLPEVVDGADVALKEDRDDDDKNESGDEDETRNGTDEVVLADLEPREGIQEEIKDEAQCTQHNEACGSPKLAIKSNDKDASLETRDVAKDDNNDVAIPYTTMQDKDELDRLNDEKTIGLVGGSKTTKDSVETLLKSQLTTNCNGLENGGYEYNKAALEFAEAANTEGCISKKGSIFSESDKSKATTPTKTDAIVATKGHKDEHESLRGYKTPSPCRKDESNSILEKQYKEEIVQLKAKHSIQVDKLKSDHKEEVEALETEALATELELQETKEELASQKEKDDSQLETMKKYEMVTLLRNETRSELFKNMTQDGKKECKKHSNDFPKLVQTICENPSFVNWDECAVKKKDLEELVAKHRQCSKERQPAGHPFQELHDDFAQAFQSTLDEFSGTARKSYAKLEERVKSKLRKEVKKLANPRPKTTNASPKPARAAAAKTTKANTVDAESLLDSSLSTPRGRTTHVNSRGRGRDRRRTPPPPSKEHQVGSLSTKKHTPGRSRQQEEGKPTKNGGKRRPYSPKLSRKPPPDQAPLSLSSSTSVDQALSSPRGGRHRKPHGRTNTKMPSQAARMEGSTQNMGHKSGGCTPSKRKHQSAAASLSASSTTSNQALSSHSRRKNGRNNHKKTPTGARKRARTHSPHPGSNKRKHQDRRST